MPETVSLGTVSAEVKIGLSQVLAARNQLKAELGQIGGALDKLADQAEKDGKRTEEALKRGLDEKKLRAYHQEIQKTHAAQMQMWSEIGRGATVAGSAITGVMVGATAAASKFDGAMRNVNSIAKQSEAQFRETTKAVIGLVDDKRITDGPTKLAEGLYDIYSSGRTGAEAIEDLKVAAMGASAGLTETATSSRVLMAVLNSGIGGVNSAKEAMDVLFREVDLGVNNFEQLAGSIGMVLPQAKLMGVNLQEVAAALATMTRQGLSAAEATTALNNLLTHIAKPGKEAQKLMEELGISYGASALEAKGLGGWLEEVSQKTHGNKDALMQLVPELRGMRGELILASENGKLYKEMLAGMGDATKGVGATQAALNEQMKGAAYQAAKAKQEIERMAIEIGQHLLPVARDVMAQIHGMTKAFHDLNPATQGAIVKFTAIGGVFLLVFGRVADLIIKIKELQGLMAASGALGAVKGAATGVGARFAGSALGGAVIGTLPVTLPAILAGALGYGLASESIADSERSIANNSLSNPERIAYLQKRLEEKGRIISQLPPRSPAIAGHIKEVEALSQELETLQYAGITASVRQNVKGRGATKPKAKTGGAGGGHPPTKAEKDAAKRAADDRQGARAAEAKLKTQKLKDQFNGALEAWDGLNPAGRAELVRLAGLITRAEQDEASIAASGSSDSPLTDAVEKQAAFYKAGQGKQELYDQIRSKTKDALGAQSKDVLGADREEIERDLSNARRDFRQLSDGYQGQDPARAGQIGQASARIELLQTRLARFDLGVGGTSATAKAKYETEVEQAKQAAQDREAEITRAEEEGEKKRAEAVQKGFKQWSHNYQQKKRDAEELAEGLEKAIEVQRRLDEDEEKWATGLEEHLQGIDDAISELTQGPLRSFNESLASGIGDSIGHFKSLEDFLGGWKMRVGRMIEDLAAQIITNWARVQIMGGAGAGAPGADGANMRLAPAIGAALGNGLGGPIGGALGGALFGKLFRFADGGILPTGTPSLVGEAGAEFIVPRSPSLAIPAAMLDQIAGRAVAMGAGGGGSSVHAPITVHVHGGLDSSADIGRLAQDLAWHIEQRQKVS